MSIICYWKAFKVILQRSICGTWTLPERGCGCLRKETLVYRVPASGAAVVWRFAERKMHGSEKRMGLTVMRPNSAALQKSIDLFHFCRIPKWCPVSGCYHQIWELQEVQSRYRWMAMLRISLGLSSSELKEQAFANWLGCLKPVYLISVLSRFTTTLHFPDIGEQTIFWGRKGELKKTHQNKKNLSNKKNPNPKPKKPQQRINTVGFSNCRLN